jgi:hypothetical protein
MKPFSVTGTGLVLRADGALHEGAEVSAGDVAAGHLQPHVETFALDADESVKILILYSCHCWTCRYDEGLHAGQMRFMDGVRARAFDLVRHDASIHLSGLMRNLPQNRIYVTRSERNYGVYSATLADADGHRYTAYFKLRPEKGRFNGVRYKLLLVVESAYGQVQPEAGMKTNFRAIVAKAREGKMVKYRR